MLNNKVIRNAVAVAATGAAVLSLGVSAGTASAKNLPGGTTTKKLLDGTTVTIRLTGEKVRFLSSSVASPAARNVKVSGKVIATVSGGTATGGTVEAGYIVGCQVNLGGVGANGGVEEDLGGGEGISIPNLPVPIPTPGTPSGSYGGGFSLGPGQTTLIPVISYTDDKGTDQGYDDEWVTDLEFEGNRGGIAYSDERISLNKCVGYAAARAYIKVTVETDRTTGIITVWGQPFSLG